MKKQDIQRTAVRFEKYQLNEKLLAKKIEKERALKMKENTIDGAVRIMQNEINKKREQFNEKK